RMHHTRRAECRGCSGTAVRNLPANGRGSPPETRIVGNLPTRLSGMLPHRARPAEPIMRRRPRASHGPPRSGDFHVWEVEMITAELPEIQPLEDRDVHAILARNITGRIAF